MHDAAAAARGVQGGEALGEGDRQVVERAGAADAAGSDQACASLVMSSAMSPSTPRTPGSSSATPSIAITSSAAGSSPASSTRSRSASEDATPCWTMRSSRPVSSHSRRSSRVDASRSANHSVKPRNGTSAAPPAAAGRGARRRPAARPAPRRSRRRRRSRSRSPGLHRLGERGAGARVLQRRATVRTISWPRRWGAGSSSSVECAQRSGRSMPVSPATRRSRNRGTARSCRTVCCTPNHWSPLHHLTPARGGPCP